MAVPKKILERFKTGLKQYSGVIQAQLDRDVSEADTVTLVKDLMSDVFGFDKYAEITCEHAIRGTYCDLAVKLDGKLRLLLEVKAIGIDLNDRHVKQAVDYAANQGIDWVILTNGIRWQLYHVTFAKPIDKELVSEVNLLNISLRSEHDLDRLYLLTREGLEKDALSDFRDRKDATSRFMIAAILTQSDTILNTIRKEIRSVSDMLVDKDLILKVLREEVIKREALEGDNATNAKRRLSRSHDKPKRKRSVAVQSNHELNANGSPATESLIS